MPGWVRTFWAAVILILPGGFLLFLGYAFGRALLQTRRAVAEAHGGDAHLREGPRQHEAEGRLARGSRLDLKP